MHDGGTRGGVVTGLRWGSGVKTAAAGVFAVTALSIGLGFVAKSLSSVVDQPFFDRIDRGGTNDWTDVVSTLTRMGNVPQTQQVAGLLAIVLAVWFWRRGRRWWMPLVVLPLTWIVSRICQFAMAAIVDRDREAISLLGTHVGAYPSGGVMRVITVGGAAVFLAAYYLRWSRRSLILGFAVVAVLGLAEAYFRARLNQHWLTDVIGGVIVGWMFVAVVVATVRSFDPDGPSGAGGSPAAQRIG